MKLLIDTDFKNILPPLTSQEYLELEKSVKEKGVLSPILTWNDYIVDGHNRYEICQTNGIEDFSTKEMKFSSKEEVLEWILSHQLGRRNLTDFQRNEVALKYQGVIAKRMKERQSMAGGDKKSANAKIAYDQMNHSDFDKTTQRKELAKIAGTSEGSIQRSKLILEKGTQEQIERARKGGKGNSVSAIAKEITEELNQNATKICAKCKKELPLTDFYSNRNICKACKYVQKKENEGCDFFGKKSFIPAELRGITGEEMIGDLYNTEKEIEYTDDDLEEELKCIIDDFLQKYTKCLQLHTELLDNEKSKDKVLQNITLLQSKLQNIKENYCYE